MPHGNPAFGGKRLKGQISIQLPAQHLLGTPLLPRRKAALCGVTNLAHVPILLRDVHGQRQRNVIDEEGRSLFWLLERTVDRAAQVPNSWIIDRCSRLKVQSANSRDIRIIANLIEQPSRYVKHERAHLGVDQGTGGLAQVVYRSLALPKRASAYCAICDPEFVIRTGSEVQMNKECVLRRERLRHDGRRPITLNQSDSNLCLMECARD